MKINSLIIKNLHGIEKFDIDIKLNPEMTFLIGINGSGKTSSLKLLQGLIAPSFNYLCDIDFTFAELICNETENDEIKIVAEKVNPNILKLTLNTSKLGEFSNDLEILPTRQNDSIVDNESLQILKQKFLNSEVVKKIQNLPTPTFLGLDRRIFEGRRPLFSVKSSENQIIGKSSQFFEKSLRQMLQNPNLTSLYDIQELVYDYFRTIPKKQTEISESFKNEVLMSFFDFVENEGISINTNADIDEVKKKKVSILNAIQNLNIEPITYRITNFFEKIEKILIEINKEEKSNKSKQKDEKFMKMLSDYFINSSQLKRIDSIIKLSQTFQEKTSKINEPVKRLEQIVSNFFIDSNKKLTIESNGELKINLTSKNPASIFELSSGERQIVVMMTYLIFYEDLFKPGVFVIDEPELSLHLAWQEIFLESIKTASPNTQFILATHSPSIIGSIENEEYCQDLSLSNRNNNSNK